MAFPPRREREGVLCMGNRDKIIAYDLGTSGIKASLYDAAGRQLADTLSTYDTVYTGKSSTNRIPCSGGKASARPPKHCWKSPAWPRARSWRSPSPGTRWALCTCLRRARSLSTARRSGLTCAPSARRTPFSRTWIIATGTCVPATVFRGNVIPYSRSCGAVIIGAMSIAGRRFLGSKTCATS